MRVLHRGAPGALAAAALALSPWAAWAQGEVVSARLRAELDPAFGEARVRLEYGLRGLSPGDSVPVTLLDFGLSSMGEIQVGGALASVRLPVAGGAAHRGHLPVETAPDGGVRLTVAYRVPLPPEQAERTAVVRLPVLTVDGAPKSARPELFRAEVAVPAGWQVLEAFPTGLRDPASGGTLAAALPVVPSMVSVRYRAGGEQGGVPLLLALNLFAGLCLALAGVAGWRHLAPRRP